MTENNALPDLPALLRQHSPDDQIVITYEQAKAVHGEIQRLTQSNDRLRKQNRKVRVKYDRLKAGKPVTENDSPDSEPSA